jgi:hypothetical protein
MIYSSMRRTYSWRTVWFVLVLSSALAGALLWSGARALAATGYRRPATGYGRLSGPFGSFSPTPTGVAVDNSSRSSAGDVYVVDGMALYKYNAAGDFLEQVSLEKSADRVAVDGSDTSSAGDVYITVPGSGGGVIPPNGGLYKLSDGSDSFAEGLVSPTGVAVDLAGNVYIAESESEVVEVTASDALLHVVRGLTKPRGIAVDSRGDLYVAGETGTVELTPNGSGGFSDPKTIDAEPAFDVAVDSRTEEVFIAVGDEVDAFASSGKEIGVVFGSETTAGNTYEAVGESEATGDVYAVNSLADSVEVAEPEEAKAPEPKNGEPKEPHETPIIEEKGGELPETPTPTPETPAPIPGPSVSLLVTPKITTTADTLTLSSAKATEAKALTNAQKLTDALKVCKRRPAKQRASCDKRALKRYGVTTKKKAKRPSEKGKKQ